MHQFMYTMQFKGYAAPVGATPHVFQVITIASSCTITAAIGAEGVHGTLQPTGGGQAAFESMITFTEETAFQASAASLLGRGAIGSSSAPSDRATSVPAPSRASSREP